MVEGDPKTPQKTDGVGEGGSAAPSSLNTSKVCKEGEHGGVPHNGMVPPMTEKLKEHTKIKETDVYSDVHPRKQQHVLWEQVRNRRDRKGKGRAYGGYGYAPHNGMNTPTNPQDNLAQNAQNSNTTHSEFNPKNYPLFESKERQIGRAHV